MLRPLQRSSLIVVLVAALSACACGSGEPVEPDAVELTSVVVLHGEGATSQDDMCIWVHPDDPEQSTIITGNKDGGNLYVYDLDGNVIQIVETQKPGNVDLRYGFPLGGRSVDIVAHSQRDDGDRLRVWAIDPVTRQLTQVDNGQVYISPGYGATLYHSASTSKYYFFKTTQERGRGGTEQYELLDDGNGKVTARSVRQWDLSGTEGMVADDRTGKLYVASEDRGILEFGAEPEDPIEGRMIARVGENGLHRDVEGLALYKTPGGGGYLIASSQGRSRFVVYKLDEAYSYAGSFTIVGVQDPDGIAVTSSGLGSRFAQGLFASHSWESEELQTVHLTPWATIVSNLE